jgi:hypothetical protein
MPDRGLPSSDVAGFKRYTGIPNTSTFKSYFASAAEALERCRRDPRCVGISATRMFYGPVSHPTLVPGPVGETESLTKVA